MSLRVQADGVALPESSRLFKVNQNRFTADEATSWFNNLVVGKLSPPNKMFEFLQASGTPASALQVTTWNTTS
jgi:hypothetical protein